MRVRGQLLSTYEFYKNMDTILEARGFRFCAVLGKKNKCLLNEGIGMDV